ncbi:MAG: hypothetical protein ACW981_11265 [Candidatus Hodarchaeales archaeon]
MSKTFKDFLKSENENKDYIKTAEYRWIIPGNKTLMFHVELPEVDRNWSISGQFLQIEVSPGGNWNDNQFQEGFLPYRTFYGDVTVPNLYTMRVNEPLQVIVKIDTPHILLNINYATKLLTEKFSHDYSPLAELWRQFVSLLPAYSSLMRADIIPVSIDTWEPIPLGSLQFTPTSNKTKIELWTQEKKSIRIKMFENVDYFEFNDEIREKNIFKIILQVSTFVCSPQSWSAGFPDVVGGQEVTFQEEYGEITLEDVIFHALGEEVKLEEKQNGN